MEQRKKKKFVVICQDDGWTYAADSEEEVMEEVDLHHIEVHSPDSEFEIEWSTIQ